MSVIKSKVNIKNKGYFELNVRFPKELFVIWYTSIKNPKRKDIHKSYAKSTYRSLGNVPPTKNTN